MSTYSVFVDGKSFDSQLKANLALSLVELLKEHFPGAVCVAIKEKKQ